VQTFLGLRMDKSKVFQVQKTRWAGF